jgi:hypothetical protein
MKTATAYLFAALLIANILLTVMLLSRSGDVSAYEAIPCQQLLEVSQ